MFVLVSGSALASNVTIRVALPDDMDQAQAFAGLIAQFEAEHPNISVELLPQFRDDFDRLAVQMVGGVAPDIITGYGQFTAQVLRHGGLLNLTPFIERDGLQDLVADFAPAAVRQFSVDGNLYGFPKYTATGALFYNTDMYNRVGLPAPDSDWTWDHFEQNAQRLTVRDANNDVVTHGYSVNNGWTWVYPWFVMGGVDFSDPYRVAMDTPAAADTAAFLYRLEQQGWGRLGWGEIFSGRSAMTTSGSWEIRGLASNISYAVAPPPTGPSGKAAQMNNDIVGINRQTAHPDEAWAFLKWFYGLEVQEQFLNEFGLSPARMSLGRAWTEIIEELVRADGNPVPEGLHYFMEAMAYVAPEPTWVDNSIIGSHIMPAFVSIIRENAEPASTLAEASRTATAILAEQR